jgi:hypothetical protein
MKNKRKSLMTAGFVTGALLATTGPVFAHDYWHGSREYNHWERADLRSDYHDLAGAKSELQRDRSHHASRQTVRNDEARIRDIEHDIDADRHPLR